MKKLKLSAGSKYFEVTATAQIGRMQVTLISLLKRDGNKISTIQRSIGVY
jgi:type II secretory pathway component PulK